MCNICINHRIMDSPQHILLQHCWIDSCTLPREAAVNALDPSYSCQLLHSDNPLHPVPSSGIPSTITHPSLSAVAGSASGSRPVGGCGGGLQSSESLSYSLGLAYDVRPCWKVKSTALYRQPRPWLSMYLHTMLDIKEGRVGQSGQDLDNDHG